LNSYGLNIDLSRDNRLSEQSLKLIKAYYLTGQETSPQEAFARAALAYSAGDTALAQRIYDYVSKGWFMFSSPILSNAPLPGEKHLGLPISCFLSYVGDTIPDITGHHEETAWLSVKGGGVGGHWGNVRGVSEKSPGVIPFMKVTDSQMTAFKQGKTRKGSYAAYLDIDHPDILEFVNFKVPTGGDSHRKCFNLFNAVNITNKFMSAVKENKTWDLICRKTKEPVETVNARELWERILEVRFRTGSPYLNFIDTANYYLPRSQRKKGLRIHGSNLCNEIHLATSEKRTAVCCLLSTNIEKYDEWKHTSMIKDLVIFLDNVLQAFIDEAPDEMSKAVFSAEQERSIGIGAMGFHAYLMKKNIPWESEEARSINEEVFKTIKNSATAATKKLATERGPCPDADNFDPVRNMHLLAIAPNANSSILCNTTASIEPIKSNYYTHRTRVGPDVVINPYLKACLVGYGMDNEEIWASIMENDGSVQHLDFMDEHDKFVFKTSFEIDQDWVVQHAADRQKYICQGQSVNLFFRSGADRAYVNKVHMKAWSEGLKGLYYLRTTAGRTADKVGSKVERVALKSDDRNILYGKEDCPWCVKASEIMDELFGPEGWEYVSLEKEGKTAAQVTGRDVTTVPQIYIAGEYVGGYDDLINYLIPKEEEFKQLDMLLDGADECVACEG
jgi:ribonucleoside-diphosphate reductase alpha chain